LSKKRVFNIVIWVVTLSMIMMIAWLIFSEIANSFNYIDEDIYDI